MNRDSVLDEVRAARDAYARSLGYDVWAMVDDLRERDECGDWPVVRLSPRHPEALDAPEPARPPARPSTATSAKAGTPLGNPAR